MDSLTWLFGHTLSHVGRYSSTADTHKKSKLHIADYFFAIQLQQGHDGRVLPLHCLTTVVHTQLLNKAAVLRTISH